MIVENPSPKVQNTQNARLLIPFIFLLLGDCQGISDKYDLIFVEYVCCEN